MTSQSGLQTIAIHILPNISQSKGKQTMKFGQLIKNNKGNIFLQKHPRPQSNFKKPEQFFRFPLIAKRYDGDEVT